jgi:NarL family two-component system response regulator LiaR
MPLEPIRVLIVASGRLRGAINSSLPSMSRVHVVGIAESGETALELVAGGCVPDVVLLDLSIRGMGAIASIRALRMCDELLSTEVIALASQHAGGSVDEALRAGAIGFLPERALRTELFKAILFAYNGMPFRVSAQAPLVQPKVSYPLPNGQELTEREYEVLRLLVRGLSNWHIADRLVITLSTVKFHTRNIRSKMGTKTRAETVAYALCNQLVPDVSAQAPLAQPKFGYPLPNGQELSERQYEVLRLLVQGLSNWHIADRLVITIATVKFHTRSIRRKLGTSNRIATVAYALRNQLVPDRSGL